MGLEGELGGVDADAVAHLVGDFETGEADDAEWLPWDVGGGGDGVTIVGAWEDGLGVVGGGAGYVGDVGVHGILLM